MTTRLARRAALGLSVTLPVVLGLPSSADDRTTIGPIRLAPGLVARYERHYDRGALVDAEREGPSLVASTASGSLLRFDLATRRITHEREEADRVVRLGRGAKNELLCGFEDGRVCRVDAERLELTDVARLPGRPRWIGAPVGNAATSKTLLAVLEHEEMVERDGRRVRSRSWSLHNAATGRTTRLDRYASAFMLDRSGRLWLGGDRGEWGGWCSYLDISTDKIVEIPGVEIPNHKIGPIWYGVYGFTQLRDGRVLAHGGTLHMGFGDGFVRRVDRGKAEEIFAAEFSPRGPIAAAVDEPIVFDRPRLPISFVLERPDGRLVVLSYGTVFETDPQFRSWARIGTLDLSYRWGRPDAVGAYPSVVAASLRDGEPGGLVVATALDGVVFVRPGETVAPASNGELGADAVARIENTFEGLLCFDEDPNAGDPWLLSQGRWSGLDRPPSLVDPLEQARPAPIDEPWNRGEVVIRVGSLGEIVAVGKSTIEKEEFSRFVMRKWFSRWDTIGSLDKSMYADACFLTPDGALWNADGVSLRRFVDGRWIVESVYGREEIRNLDRTAEDDGGFRTIGAVGPPWTLLDPAGGRLLRLSRSDRDKKFHLNELTLSERNRALQATDAIPWGRLGILLATDAGLRIYDAATDSIRPSPFPESVGTARKVVRDGSGRVWVAGEGLTLLRPIGEIGHVPVSFPPLNKSKVLALAADPARPAGVVAGTERGLYFVRIEEAK